jgi:hypothetical protein
MLPVACRRCIHLIAELGLTSNQSAASRRDAPDSTASTTRSLNSKEHGFGIDPPSKTRINARQIQLSKPAGESRFNSAEIRSNTILVLLCRGFHRLDLDVRRAAVQSLQHVVSTCPPIVAIVAVVMVARRDANQKSFGKRAWWRMPACLTLRQLLITLEF